VRAALLVNDAQQEQDIVADEVGGGVADAVAGVGQVARGNDRVQRVAREKLVFKHWECSFLTGGTMACLYPKSAWALMGAAPLFYDIF